MNFHLKSFALSLLLCATSSSQAAVLRVFPEAAQHDKDPVNDLILEKEAILGFNLSFFDPTEGNPATKRLDLLISYDHKELSPGIFLESHHIKDLPNNPPLEECKSFTCINYIIDFNEPLDAGKELDLGTIFFKAEELANDGFIDFDATGLFYDNNLDEIGGFNALPFEVQQVPGPLPILGVGVFGAYARKFRKLSQRLKSAADMRSQ
jgi:hypothetical protein